jgi:hypothetical protein
LGVVLKKLDPMNKERKMERFAIKAMTYIAHAREVVSIDHILGKNENDNDKDESERGDVPGWVLVVLMTTGLVTAIWTIAAPRLSTILRNSLDAMNGIR